MMVPENVLILTLIYCQAFENCESPLGTVQAATGLRCVIQNKVRNVTRPWLLSRNEIQLL